ncbi:hypothetical protein WG922_13480 [Ramlibacter sp. AN1015]|uniref:hypothetical protein n=1 Tax=Ramlibacter sp. AN1015 TaxID=3133428 RepID=UPI0030C5B886
MTHRYSCAWRCTLALLATLLVGCGGGHEEQVASEPPPRADSGPAPVIKGLQVPAALSVLSAN